MTETQKLQRALALLRKASCELCDAVSQINRVLPDVPENCKGWLNDAASEGAHACRLTDIAVRKLAFMKEAWDGPPATQA